jgi:hypothetical protein
MSRGGDSRCCLPLDWMGLLVEFGDSRCCLLSDDVEVETQGIVSCRVYRDVEMETQGIVSHRIGWGCLSRLETQGIISLCCCGV